MQGSIQTFCEVCGAEIHDGHSRCNQCGASVEDAKPDSEDRLQPAPEGEPDTQSLDWRANIVSDESAPSLYSVPVIFGFTAIMSSLFGAILMILNLRAMAKPEGIVPVLTFGLGVSAVQWISVDLDPSYIFYIVINLVGAGLLSTYFWNKFIGARTKYRLRPIVVPLIVAVILTIVPILILLTRRAA